MVKQPGIEVIRQICDYINIHQAKDLASHTHAQEGSLLKPHVRQLIHDQVLKHLCAT